MSAVAPASACSPGDEPRLSSEARCGAARRSPSSSRPSSSSDSELPGSSAAAARKARRPVGPTDARAGQRGLGSPPGAIDASAARQAVIALGDSIPLLAGDGALGSEQRELTLAVACCLATVLRVSAAASLDPASFASSRSAAADSTSHGAAAGAAGSTHPAAPASPCAVGTRLTRAIDAALRLCEARSVSAEAHLASLAGALERWVERVGAGEVAPTTKMATSPSGMGARGLAPWHPEIGSPQPDSCLPFAAFRGSGPADLPEQAATVLGGDAPENASSRAGLRQKQSQYAPVSLGVESLSARAELRARLESIRAAGPGAAAALLAAEDVAVQAALLRRIEARSRGGGWARAAGWFLAPIVPCVISVIAARYHIAAQVSGGSAES